MYFHDRAQAGSMLADQLQEYRWHNTAVVALSPGGVVVGEQIAMRLHASLSLLLTSKISAPGDASLILGTMDPAGIFTYNSMIAAGEMEEYMQDMRTYLEEEKIRQLYQMTSVIGEHGMTDPAQLDGRIIILATDGVNNGMSVDAALHFLRRINTAKVIAAIPVGPPEVVERLSRLVDELQYLYLPDNFISVSHYFTAEDHIIQSDVMDRIDNVVLHWQ